MNAKYFAWIRERIGLAEETLDPPPGVDTVGDLITWLKTRNDSYAHAFADTAVVGAAIDHVRVKHDASIADVCEIAFFPPMTGG